MRHLQPQQYHNFIGGGGNKSAVGDGYPRSTSDAKGKSKILYEQDAGDDDSSYNPPIQHLQDDLENEDDSSDNPPIQPPLIAASAVNTDVIETTAPTADPTSPFTPTDNLVLLPDHAIQPPRKKQKRSSASHNLNPVILSQIQFNGISLIHTLMASARAVHEESFLLAEILLTQAGSLAASQSGPMTKVASYFSEALAGRIHRKRLPNTREFPIDDIRLVLHFYEACPYLKFAHFTANQALLEAFDGKKKVHVIDFSMNDHGYQWPALLQTLAVRHGGPPSFRLTVIGVPTEGNSNQESGEKLGQLADAIHVKFVYKLLVVESLADIEAAMFDLRDDEVVAVNSIFEFHKQLAKPGSVEKLLSAVKAMKPEIVTMVEQEANHNGVDFIERFNESLMYYGTMFDSLESSCNRDVEGGARFPAVVREKKSMSEIYLGKEICNVVACEGEERVERHERLTQWKTRFELAGFQASRLGSYAFRQATMFIEILAGGAGYIVDECDGCLMLGWHSRPLITTSAWKLR